MKSLKPNKMKQAYAEPVSRPANAFKEIFEKMARRAKAAAGAAALGAALAIAPSCSGRMDLSHYEATDSIEVPDNEEIQQCVPNTKVAYRANLRFGKGEKIVTEGSSVDIGDTTYIVSFKEDGTLVLTDPRGKQYEVRDTIYLSGTYVEVLDRSTDLIAYEGRVLASLFVDQSKAHLILAGPLQKMQHTVGGVDVEVSNAEVESWDYGGVFVTVRVAVLLDGREYDVSGMLTPSNSLSMQTPAGEVSIRANEFVIEQFPAKDVNACDKTAVVAYIRTEPNTVSAVEEGGMAKLANGAIILFEKVFPTVEGKAAAAELSLFAGEKYERKTVLAGEILSVENENGKVSFEFLGAAFQTTPQEMQP